MKFDLLKPNQVFAQYGIKPRALAYMREQKGKHFDPAVVKAFDEIIMLEQRGYRKK